MVVFLVDGHIYRRATSNGGDLGMCMFFEIICPLIQFFVSYVSFIFGLIWHVHVPSLDWAVVKLVSNLQFYYSSLQYGDTALIRAAQEGYAGIVQILVDRGAAVDQRGQVT